ncbi:MAG: YdeI/OmpD-associated family protein [Candidatus Acidiferrales bacterium]
MDALLCFGWIDGIRKSINEVSYTIRVTPRTSKSKWSAINVKRIPELKRLGLLHATGLKAFEARTAENTYSYEQRNVAKLGGRFDKLFQANKTAWDFFRSQTPSYQRTATWWVISAKKEETKLRRLERLMEDSARGRSIAPLKRPAKSK